jgi:hypothetical protein
VTVAQGITTTDTRALVAAYNGTAMGARIPLEQGDWTAAAGFPAPADSAPTVAAALRRFTRAIGSARSGRPDAARPEVTALDSLAAVLDAVPEPYWARGSHQARHGCVDQVRLGDTAGGLAAARAAAPMPRGDRQARSALLPAKELEADMLLAAGRYARRAGISGDAGESRAERGASSARRGRRISEGFGGGGGGLSRVSADDGAG